MRGPLCGHLHKTCVCSSVLPIGSLPHLPPHQLHSTPGPCNTCPLLPTPMGWVVLGRICSRKGRFLCWTREGKTSTLLQWGGACLSEVKGCPSRRFWKHCSKVEVLKPQRTSNSGKDAREGPRLGGPMSEHQYSWWRDQPKRGPGSPPFLYPKCLKSESSHLEDQ